MRRILRLTVFLLGGVVIAMPATGQVVYGSTYISPSFPLFPKSHDECRALDAKWQTIRDGLSQQHQPCLNAAAKRGKPCPDDTATGCSCTECAPFHNPANLGGDAVAKCTKQVNEYLQKVALEKREAEEKKQKDAERRRVAEEAKNQRKVAATPKAGTAAKGPATSTTERSPSRKSEQKPARAEPPTSTQSRGPSNTQASSVVVHPESGGGATTPDATPNNRGAETAAELINPFGKQPAARTAQPSGELVNPFSGSSNASAADSATPPKPPFSATPLGQKLSPNHRVTDPARSSATAHSPLGGYPGLTRSGGLQLHQGLDDQGPISRPRLESSAWSANVETTYTGEGPGWVKEARKAFASNGDYLGWEVTIIYRDAAGEWESTTMHHREVRVKPQQTVHPGQVIAVGAGEGDQFRSPSAGAPHVHWTLKRNGILVNPLSGEKVQAQ